MTISKDLYKEYIMARKSKYKKIILEVLPRRFISTNAVIREIKKKEGKSVHHYLVGRLLKELEEEGKIEKNEIRLGKVRIFMWRRR